MDDLISRQAAIDALRNRWLKTMNFDGIGEDIAEECEICLRTVPSVQPDERMLHESCTDCPLYDKDRHSCPRFNKVIPETLRALQSAQPERMTNFELITQDENTLANWLSYTRIDCNKCPVGKECVKDDGPIYDRCFRLICEWLKREA